MKLTNFKQVHEQKDHEGTVFRIWSGPSVKGQNYKMMGVKPELDRVFYIQVCTRQNGTQLESGLYRFTYDDQIKLLDLVINNKQIQTAKANYGIMMIKHIFAWIGKDFWFPAWNIKELKEILAEYFEPVELKNKPREPKEPDIPF